MIVSTSLWSERRRKNTLLVLLLVSLSTIAIAFLSAFGVRGTDQYWYLADVITLINGQPPLSNLHFPRSIIEGSNHKNYFIHNGPALYLSALIGRAIGAYEGWLVMNFISNFIIATSIYFTSLKCTSDKEISLTCCFLYLVSPIAVWQSLNMMQEQFYGAVLAIILLSYCYRKNILVKHIYPLTLLFSFPIHPLFTVLTSLYIASNIYKATHYRDITKLLNTAVFTLVSIIIYHVFKGVFATTFPPTYTSIIAGSVPKVSNMLWQYSDNLPQINTDFIFNKLVVAIRLHVLEFPTYFYTNASLLSVAYLIIRRPRATRRIQHILFVIMACYLALSILMQTQPRYQQIFAVANFLLIAIYLNEFRGKINTVIKNTLFIGTATASITVSLYLCFTYYKEATQERISLAEMTKAFSNIPSNVNILLSNSDHETKLSYILRSRKILSIKEDFLDEETHHYVITTFDPNYVISTSPVASFLLPHHLVQNFSTSFLGDFYIYQVHKPSRNNQEKLHHTALIR